MLTTRQLAEELGYTPESIRVHLSRKGSFFGIKPMRLPNGRLMWPSDTVAKILAAGEEREAEIQARAQEMVAARRGKREAA